MEGEGGGIVIVVCVLCGDVRHVVFWYAFQYGFKNWKIQYILEWN